MLGLVARAAYVFRPHACNLQPQRKQQLHFSCHHVRRRVDGARVGERLNFSCVSCSFRDGERAPFDWLGISVLACLPTFSCRKTSRLNSYSLEAQASNLERIQEVNLSYTAVVLVLTKLVAQKTSALL